MAMDKNFDAQSAEARIAGEAVEHPEAAHWRPIVAEAARSIEAATAATLTPAAQPA